LSPRRRAGREGCAVRQVHPKTHSSCT
jgi:hypothetical protein